MSFRIFNFTAILLFFLLVLLNGLTLAYLYFRDELPFQLFAKPAIIASDASVNLPISKDNSEVSQVAVGYSFDGSVVQIIDKNSIEDVPSTQAPFKQIVTDISPATDLPQFYLTRLTRVLRKTKTGALVDAAMSDLNIGQKVTLNVWHELDMKRWILKEIIIWDK